MKKFLEWFVLKNFIAVHSITLYVTIWITWESFMWASNFAEMSTRDGAEIAMIISAVLTPVSILQGFSFRNYSKRPKNTLTEIRKVLE